MAFEGYPTSATSQWQRDKCSYDWELNHTRFSVSWFSTWKVVSSTPNLPGCGNWKPWFVCAVIDIIIVV